MAKLLVLGTLTAATLAAGCGMNPSAQLGGNTASPKLMTGQALPGELLVQLKPGATLKSVPGATVVDTLDLETLGKFVLVKTQPMQAAAVTPMFTAQAGVVGVGPNRYVEVEIPQAKTVVSLPKFSLADLNDPLYGKQWYVSHIGADKAWSKSTGKGVVAAVVDTGIDLTHPDLAGQFASDGYSFVNNKPSGLDEQGHGTHVGGTIAAVQNNGEGVTGIAPGAKLLPVQVLAATGGGSLYTIAKGIKFAADYGVTNKVHVVVNLSLGGAATVDAVSYTTGWYATGKGALLVAAAGNSNTVVGTPARWDKYYMAVSAIDDKDEKASFSNFGPEISVGAPGTNIVATTPTYDVPLNKFGYSKFYAALQGTSMACPVVTGTCVLVWSQHPEWNWKQVRAHVEKTAKDFGKSGHDDIYGYGLVQPAVAVGAL